MEICPIGDAIGTAVAGDIVLGGICKTGVANGVPVVTVGDEEIPLIGAVVAITGAGCVVGLAVVGEGVAGAMEFGALGLNVGPPAPEVGATDIGADVGELVVGSTLEGALVRGVPENGAPVDGTRDPANIGTLAGE